MSGDRASICVRRDPYQDFIGITRFPDRKRYCLYYQSGARIEVLAAGITFERACRLREVLLLWMSPQIEKGRR